MTADLQVLGGPPRRARRRRRAAALIALTLGVAGLGASATGLAVQVLPRQFTPAQQHQIEAWEIASRWQQLTAAQIFPPTVSYTLSAAVLEDAVPLSLDAVRIAIAPQSTCAQGVTSKAAAAVLSRSGCRAVLRATYVDATSSYVMTIGVAVLPSASAARDAGLGLSQAKLTARRSRRTSQLVPGVEVVRFRGSAAGRYDYNRQIAANFSAGPYLVMYAAGYADSRPQVPVAEDSYSEDEMTSLAVGVAQSVAHTLAAAPPVPHCPGAPQC
ncbi:MAG TPA: hypothetical protein VME19_02990 [Streptosporangiaceae bacterium]|nr:hypothetical protein [Streptosporangiaceae bacterium]